MLHSDSPISNEAVIKDLIEADLSNFKKARMQEGVGYYNLIQDILDIDFREYIVSGQRLIDENKANNHVINPFHRLLVQQKIGYIAGNPIAISAEDEMFSKRINDVLDDKFNDIISDYIKAASNKGVEWLHPYIDSDGNFDYIITPAEQIIPIYDTSLESNLQTVIRYYPMKVIKGEDKKIRYKVEWWDNEKVTYYMQEESGYYFLDDTELINPRYHWYSYNTLNPTEKKPNSWGKVPFIRLDNNAEQLNDLMPIKSYIDAYDKVSSGFLNDIEDIQMAIWILKGYEGTDLSEFMRNLIQFKAIKVSETGGVEGQTLEIPVEARKVILELLEDKIYEIGQGVRMSTDKFGQNPSGVALKFLYSGLDLKANTTIRKLKKALQEFMWFVTEYINIRQNTNYDYKTVKFTVNKTMITNQAEQIQNCASSKGIISDKTIIANHPWVDNVDDELELITKQQEEEENNLSGLNFNNQ